MFKGGAKAKDGIDTSGKVSPWARKGPPDFESFAPDLETAMRRHPHLKRYVDAWVADGNDPPDYERIVPHTAAKLTEPNLLYPVGDPIYIHISVDAQMGSKFTTIEPRLDQDGIDALRVVRQVVFRRALYEDPPKDDNQLALTIEALFEDVIREGDKVQLPDLADDDALNHSPAEAMRALLQDFAPQIALPREMREAVRYRLLRDIVGNGPIEPVMRDPYIEDIHSVGVDHCFIIHKYFGMVKSNIRFDDDVHLEKFLENLAERIGRPVSESQPIVDATLKDNSRINIIYSDNVSRRGPSFSIRRVEAKPVPITRLIQWGTLDARMAAYLWICLNNHQSVFLCGEAACGKTMTLNALMSFIEARSKIYTAEDTPEVQPPHQVWQRLITRETGPEDGRVEMFDLLKAALRSRPNYIVVGEIRGAEGNVAFQAMQTGHPVVASFHASSVTKMIQRLISAPIHVPLTFIDNLNVAVIQQAIKVGNRIVRRITNIEEIEGYSELDGGVLTRPVFSYDAVADKHTFRGRNNSHILEKKIAEILGYADPRQIYVDLDERAAVLRAMVENEIYDYERVNEMIDLYSREGVTALPFKVAF
ncbi:MAG: type II/IV secretion system ATPase subunit [Euryarchaeota archaeon]|nr:type II/IV secretion system ATPase subunit [Euryarchaeota archaeon]